MSVKQATGYERTTREPLDVLFLSGSAGEVYSSAAAVNTAVDINVRYTGSFFNVSKEIWWYKNGVQDTDLIPFSSTSGSTDIASFQLYTASLNSYTQSNDIRVANVYASESKYTLTSSFQPFTSSLHTYTASVNTQLNNIYVSESNYLPTASFTPFSSSVDARILNNSSSIYSVAENTYTKIQVNNFFSGSVAITGYNKSDWDTAYTNRISSFTTTGSSGAATLVSNALNIPTYTLAGLGGIANTGTAQRVLFYNNSGNASVSSFLSVDVNGSGAFMTIAGGVYASTNAQPAATFSNLNTNNPGYGALEASIPTNSTDSTIFRMFGKTGSLTRYDQDGVRTTLWLAGTGNRLLGLDTNGKDYRTSLDPALILTNTPSALTKTDDTNITLTLGGTPSTALLQAVSLTLGWTGTLADSRITSAATWNAKQTAYTNLSTIGALANGNGFLRQNGSGVFSYDTNTYLTANQTITLSGDVSGTGTTAITTTIGTNKVLDSMINSVAFSKLTGLPATLAGHGITNAYTIAQTDSAISAATVGLLDDRGNFDASVNAYPSSGGSGTSGAILKGDLWTISVGGTLPTGKVVTAGDVVRALVDTPGNTQANWAIGENNFGYVALNQALASGNIYVGSVGGIGTAVALSGNVTMTAAGVVTIGATQVANSMLVNSGITIGSSSVSLGGTLTTIAGLTSVTSTTFVGAVTGNATTATTLATPRTISGTGEATFTTTSFDGSANVSGAVTLTNSAVIGKVLTGYTSSAGTVAATDSILQAIQKINGNVSAIVSGVSSVSGTTNRITTSPTTGAVIVDISSAYVGQASITTLGTIGTGVWQGTAIGDTYISSAANWNTAFNTRIQFGLLSARPTAGTAGRNYFATDNSIEYYDNGTSWVIKGGALTGDITTTAGSLATTLATVNSNVGSFGSSTSVPTFTVNAKGLITAASTTAIPTATTSVTGLLTSTDWNTFNGKESALTFSTGLTRTTNTITVNTTQNISTLSNLTTAGFVKTSAAGVLSVDANTYLTGITAALVNAVGAITNSTSGNAATATNSTQWNGRQNDFSNYGTSLSWIAAWDGVNSKLQPFNASQVQAFLGLGSNAYTSTAYLPLTGGTLTGTLNGITINIGEMSYNSNQIYRNSANEMYVNYSGTGNTILGNGTGNVSVNAGTSPSYRLHVGGTLGVTGYSTFNSGADMFGAFHVKYTPSSIDAILSYTSSVGVVGTASNHGFDIYTNSISRVQISSTGAATFNNNVSVGGTFGVTSTASVGSTLTVGSTGNALIYAGANQLLIQSASYTQLFRRDGSVGIFLGGSADQNNYYDNGGHIFRNASGTSLFTINSSANTTISAVAATDNYINFYRAGYENWYFGSRSNSTQLSIWSGTNSNVLSFINGGAATFGSSLTANTVQAAGVGLNATPSSMGGSVTYARWLNSSGDLYIGIESSTAGGFFTGSSAYANVFYSAQPYQFIISGTKRVEINSSGITIGSGSGISVTAGDIQFTSNAGYGILSADGNRRLSVTNSGVNIPALSSTTLIMNGYLYSYVLSDNLVNNANTLSGNNTGSYTQWKITGSKSSYGGIYDTYSAVNGIMYDSSGNGGVYREPNGRWYLYYHVANDCMGIGSSSTSSSYGVYHATKGYYSGGGANYFAGYITAPAGGGTSDLRVKNVHSIDSKQSVLDLLHLRKYNFSENKELDTRGDERVRWGFATDDIREKYPELIFNIGSTTQAESLNYTDLHNMAIIELRDTKAEKTELELLREEVKELRNQLQNRN